jgi:predicted nucleic acid-binding protein
LKTVVSDSGPLIHLAQINRLWILQKLFGCILVTPSVKVEVVNEGIKRKCPDAAVVDEAFKDGWIKEETLSASALKQAAKLADGEGISPADAEVILLSRQKKALFLSDDTALLKIAEMYGLKELGHVDPAP